MPSDSTTPEMGDTTPAAPDATPCPMDPEMLEVMRHSCRPSLPHGTMVYVDHVRPLIGDRDHWEAETASAKAACDALRERCETFESAAKNLRMVVSADRGGIPCRSPGGADCPPKGWHFIFGGPYTSYTMPEPDEDGDLVWWVFDEDEGAWTEAQSLGSRVVSDEELEAIETRLADALPPAMNAPPAWVHRRIDAAKIALCWHGHGTLRALPAEIRLRFWEAVAALTQDRSGPS